MRFDKDDNDNDDFCLNKKAIFSGKILEGKKKMYQNHRRFASDELKLWNFKALGSKVIIIIIIIIIILHL